MPIAIKDLDGGLGNLISGMGLIATEEYTDTLKKHLTQDEDKFKKYRYSLCDYTTVIGTNLSYETLSQIADLCKCSSKVNPDTIIGVVANKDLIYGLARMTQMLLDDTGWEFEVFRNREDAESWIRERVKEKYGIDDLTME